VKRRLRGRDAQCTWALPDGARGETVSAVVIVAQGKQRALAPFRATVS
jgi:hypothetical protein